MLLNSHNHTIPHYIPIPIVNDISPSLEPDISLLASDMKALADNDVPIILPRGLNILPRAMLHASQQEDPMNGRTPALWEAMPLSLTSPVIDMIPTEDEIDADNDDDDDYIVVLELLPDGPCQAPDSRYQFAPTGKSTDFLRRIIRRIQQQQNLTRLTQEMIDLLHQIGALVPAIIDAPNESIMVFRVEMDRLAEKLRATGSNLQLSTFCFAQLVVQSQQSMPPLRDMTSSKRVLH